MSKDLVAFREWLNKSLRGTFLVEAATGARARRQERSCGISKRLVQLGQSRQVETGRSPDWRQATRAPVAQELESFYRYSQRRVFEQTLWAAV